MTNYEFKEKMRIVCELDDKVSSELWNLYLSFLPRFQFNEQETFQFIVLVYQKSPHMDFENFSEAMCMVYDKNRSMNINVFDVFSLDEWKEKMKQFIEPYKERISPKEYQVILSYSNSLCDNQYDMYQQTLLSDALYFEEQLSDYAFTKNKDLYGQNISYCVEIYAFVKDYLECQKIPFNKNELKETIVQTYEEYENPSLYQGRLNYVLGNYSPIFDTLEEVSNFLINYFQSEKIHNCFKDMYFLAGYFNQYDLTSFDVLEESPMMDAGKRYFMNDEQEDKEKTFVQNVFDYFMDEQQEEKNLLFLCGLMIEGSNCVRHSLEKEKVFQKVS